MSHLGYDSRAQPDINQITRAGARCERRVKTFCSRKISSHVEVVFFTILVTTLRIMVLAIKI